MKIFLLGMPGSGKSTWGKMLAEELEVTFCDLDEEIENVAGTSIEEIFEEKGEDHFRNMETEVLEALIKKNGEFILSTGGGTPCFNKNMKVMLKKGTPIFIDTPLEIITQRLKNETHRPLLKNKADREKFLKELFLKRIPHYSRASYVISSYEDLLDLVKSLKKKS